MNPSWMDPLWMDLLPTLCMAPFGLLGVAGMIGWVFYNRNQWEQKAASLRLGEVARRLGLNLLQGAADYNLAVPTITFSDYDVRARAEGAPLGLKMTLDVIDWVRFAYGGRRHRSTRESEFRCRLSIECQRPFPAFEIVSVPMGYISVERATNLPIQPTRALNYVIATEEPRLAAIVSEHLHHFEQITKMGGLLIVGDGESVTFEMRRNAPSVGTALYYPEQLSQGLHAIARAIGG